MHVVDDNADGMGAVGMILFGHVGVQSLVSMPSRNSGLNRPLTNSIVPCDTLRVVGDGGDRGVCSGRSATSRVQRSGVMISRSR